MPAGGAAVLHRRVPHDEAGLDIRWYSCRTPGSAPQHLSPARVLKPAEQGVAQMGGWQLAKLPVRGLGVIASAASDLLVGGAQQR